MFLSFSFTGAGYAHSDAVKLETAENTKCLQVSVLQQQDTLILLP